VLPTKKFPELKLVINGEQRTSNTLSSDEELQLNFPPIKKVGNQNSVMNSSSVVGHHHHSTHHYQGGAQGGPASHNKSTYGTGTIKKKTQHKQPGGGMINAHNPSGTIHVTNHYAGGQMASGQSLAMMSTDFKSTMKHNSSNHSIPSNKKMASTIRKPTDLLGGGATHYGITNAPHG